MNTKERFVELENLLTKECEKYEKDYAACPYAKECEEYKNVVAAFNSLVLAEDFINLVIPAETRKRFYIEHR